MNRRGFLKLAGAGLTALAGVKYVDYERYWYKVQSLSLTLPNLPAAFKGFTLTHLTDLHLNIYNTPDAFREVAAMANELHSDIIVITGDFVDWDTPEYMYDNVVEVLSLLQAEQGVYAVLGNHDHWLSYGVVRRILTASRIVELPNQFKAFERDGERLYLCGLDDYYERQTDMNAVTDLLPEDACAILMVHEPDYADISAVTGQFALQLSGHSHGGQVDIPLVGPLELPLYGEKYPRGLYTVGEMLLYTSTGIGMTSPRVRFNCRPEIVQITLV